MSVVGCFKKFVCFIQVVKFMGIKLFIIIPLTIFLVFIGYLVISLFFILLMKLKDTSWKKSYNQPRQHIKKQRHYFTNKGPSSQGYGFFNSHVWM